MKEKRLYVKLLGDFSVWYGDERVNMGRSSAGRLAQLFQLLMISPGYQISKEKLMADLYKSGELSNKNNSINNVIYRLRKMLIDANVPGDEYIVIENGNCIWKSEIPVFVDAAEFKRLIDESSQVPEEERLRMLKEAWLLYRGPFLASNSIEEWAIPENLHYKELYRNCTNQIADTLRENELWEDLYTLYTTAVSIEPYEEWQLGQLDALIALGQYEKAYQVYECPYPTFMDVYCSLKRISARTEIFCCLMQCTIINRKKLPVQKAVAAKKGKLLGDAIKNTLRYGDIFTQYNTARFLLILNHTRKEDGKIVFKRIAQVYEEMGGNKRDIDYQITPMYEE